MPTVVCVLRAGGEFQWQHVDALYRAVAKQWPLEWNFRFVCLTDDPMVPQETRPLQRPWPRWWAKMELCAPEHDDLGDMLYFDLDTMVVGDLREIAKVDRPTLLADFYRPEAVTSGMMYLPVEERQGTWAAWLWRGPDEVMWQHRARGDGAFLDELLRERVWKWQDVLPGQVVSYKQHVRHPYGKEHEVVPRDARVICFHGFPRPWITGLWREYA